MNSEMEGMVLVADNCTQLTANDEDLGGDSTGAVQVHVDETPAAADDDDYNHQIERTTLPSSQSKYKGRQQMGQKKQQKSAPILLLKIHN